MRVEIIFHKGKNSSLVANELDFEKNISRYRIFSDVTFLTLNWLEQKHFFVRFVFAYNNL